MSLMKAVLIVSSMTHPHVWDVDVIPVESMADCSALRVAVASSLAPIEEFQIADDGTFFTPEWALKNISGFEKSVMFELKCKPVGKQD